VTLRQANRVGLLIGLTGGIWLAYQFYSSTSLIYTLPWPASLLPYLGPLLMVLMPARLFRPKHVGDWWGMQGIGLAAVGLASAMAEDEVFGLLLALYSLAGVSSLTLFYYRRSGGTLPPVPGGEPGPATTVIARADGKAPGRAVFWKSLRWLIAAGAIALPLFFLTPRAQTNRWQFGKTREVGFGADQAVDLNRTGELRVTREPAWQVRVAHADGQPKLDLNPNQRFRGAGYHQYENGLWRQNTVGNLILKPTVFPVPPAGASLATVLPAAGPDAYFLTFTPRGRGLEPILADPTTWRVGESSPVASLTTIGPRLWTQITDASFKPPPTGMGRIASYTQVINPAVRPPDEDVGSPFELARSFPIARTERASLVYQYTEMKVPRIRSFAVDLLERLAAADPALRAALNRAETRRSFELAPEDFERVGRAFAHHLALSGEYTYSLTTRRTDRTIDPVEDFLLNTRAGHCERFAAALALLLRAVGVPAVYVLGFKGCEPEGDGIYSIRQDHAHAWVEILVPRPAPRDFPFAPRINGASSPDEVWHWLSLDPSPTGADDAAGGIEGWFGTARQTWANFFLDFIVGYNSDRRDRAVESVREWVTEWRWVVLTVPLIALAGWGARRVYRQARGDPAVAAANQHSGHAWFDHLVATLAEVGLVRRPGVTPGELADRAAAALRDDPRTSAVADVPVRVTRAFYRARYANQPPRPDEVPDLEAAVTGLRTHLRTAGWTVRPEGSP
jgi:transglutaminase-like putative cysteine protease